MTVREKWVRFWDRAFETVVPPALVMLCVIGGIGFLVTMTAVRDPAPSKPDPLVAAVEALTLRVHDLDEHVTTMAAARCMTVNTPVLNVSVYDTPNLGTKPKVEKEKRP